MIDTAESKSKFVLNDAVIFDLILIIFFIVLAIMSLNYNPRARSIPMALGIVGSLMMFLQFLADAIPGLRSRLKLVVQGGILGGDELDHKNGNALRYWWQVLRLVFWLAGFTLLLLWINYLIVVGAFVVLIIKVESKASWLKAIVMAVCVDASFYVLFDLILQAGL